MRTEYNLATGGMTEHPDAPPSPVDPQDAIKAQIATLEATITPRRLREAVLTGDHSFVADVEAQIKAIRESV